MFEVVLVLVLCWEFLETTQCGQLCWTRGLVNVQSNCVVCENLLCV